MEAITAASLRERHRAIRSTQSEALAIRLHRAISWLQRAEQNDGDNDTRFIQLWIAFNAIYAGEFDDEKSERERVADFVARLVASDERREIHSLLFSQYSGPIRLLIDNRYVFAPFWRAQRDHDSSDRWRQRFEQSRKTALEALLSGRTAELLVIVLDRLYVLRNQLIHGGATWNSAVNREQLRDACALLGSVVPAIISLVMESTTFDGDAISYPVLPDLSPPKG